MSFLTIVLHARNHRSQPYNSLQNSSFFFGRPLIYLLKDIFGSSLDSARYGNTEEEWVEVPISLLPGEEDECGSMKQPRKEPQMMQMYEELNKIDVIKADGSKKCDFYRETEGYECVPYYQCDEGTIITDGGGLIDIRFGGESDQPELAILDFSDLMCSGSLDVCCKDPDFTKDQRLNWDFWIYSLQIAQISMLQVFRSLAMVDFCVSFNKSGLIINSLYYEGQWPKKSDPLMIA